MEKNIPKLIGITILFLVGIYLLYSVISYSPPKFTSAGKLNYLRTGSHTTTLLANGEALIVGGMGASSSINISIPHSPLIATAEIYNPKTKKVYVAGNVNYARANHTATLLKDGRVLIIGGFSDAKMIEQVFSLAEVYNPKTNLFYSKKLNYKYDGRHSSTLLKDGKALITGGYRNETEIYDPNTDKFYTAGNMNYTRKNHTATLLKDGRVLIAGGNKNHKYLAKTGEIYNPETDKFTITGNMNYPRIKHTATLLKDGRVLISGGTTILGAFELLPIFPASLPLEIYNPDSGNFTVVKDIPPMPIESTTLLKDGRILFVVLEDNGHSIKIYDPKANKLTIESQSEKLTKICQMTMKTLSMNTTLLQDGSVLFVGNTCNNAILYTP